MEGKKMERMIVLLKKYKSVLSYLFFGVCTTAINVVVYNVCYERLGIENIPSVIIAWFIAVAFAYATNKLFVFESKVFEKRALLKEILSFYSCRILTGLFDVAIMYLAVDVMSGNSTIWKIISNLVVIALNYVASRMFIFKK